MVEQISDFLISLLEVLVCRLGPHVGTIFLGKIEDDISDVETGDGKSKSCFIVLILSTCVPSE